MSATETPRPELHEALVGLKPAALWAHFNELRQIPRPSGQEVGVVDYIEKWAQEKGFNVAKDSHGNIVVYVPGSSGHENQEPLALQAHMDMVTTSADKVVFDFSKQPIDIEREGDLIRSKG